MSFVAVNSDGSNTPLGVITGYQVSFVDGRKKQTKNFQFLWQALGFQKTLRQGSASSIAPVYAAK